MRGRFRTLFTAILPFGIVAPFPTRFLIGDMSQTQFLHFFVGRSSATLLSLNAYAPNEAGGGSWIANRFRSRFYNMVALLCETDQKLHGFSREDILLLEKTIAVTPIEVKEKQSFDTQVENTGSSNAKIILSLESWSFYFTKKLDVHREVLSILWERVLNRKAPLIAAIDTVSLLPIPAGNPGPRSPWIEFQYKNTRWAVRRAPGDAQETAARCEELNKPGQQSALLAFSWQQPSSRDAGELADRIGQQLTFEMAEPSHLRLFFDDKTVDWMASKGYSSISARRGAILCEGFTR
ncbi:MAG: hypothetical protein HYR96_07285 [Deltaproteobacteria bacterium]|nr:hypothetical protein [Deltaproteobacteria bacterium]MBI3295144.1 hypothetical protein [Deltaproteobacteria bacterium]